MAPIDVQDLLDRLRACVSAFVEKLKQFFNELYESLKQLGLLSDALSAGKKYDYRRDIYNGKRLAFNDFNIRGPQVR